MGHALWTSPITGYRRKGTRFAELRDLIEAGITARAILEPLQSCWTEAPALEMARLLKTRDFDLAGVQAEKDAPVIGFVETAVAEGWRCQRPHEAAHRRTPHLGRDASSWHAVCLEGEAACVCPGRSRGERNCHPSGSQQAAAPNLLVQPRVAIGDASRILGASGVPRRRLARLRKGRTSRDCQKTKGRYGVPETKTPSLSNVSRCATIATWC